MVANVPEHVQLDHKVVAEATIVQAILAEPLVVYQQPVAIPQHLGGFSQQQS